MPPRRPHIKLTEVWPRDDDEDDETDCAPVLEVPNYHVELTPTVSPGDSADNAIPCADWKGCMLSCLFLMVAVFYGLVCGVAGYHLRSRENCNKTTA